MSWDIIFKLVIGVLGLATATIVAIDRIKEYKIRRARPDFKPNPRRCEEMRDRVTVLEGQNKVWETRLDGIEGAIAGLGKSIDTLISLHMKE